MVPRLLTELDPRARHPVALQTFAEDGGWWFGPIHDAVLPLVDRSLRARNAVVVRQLGKVLPISLPFLHSARRGRVLVLTSWAKDNRFFPHAWWREPVVYAIDCWPKDYDRWETLLRRAGVRLALFSARDAAAEMASRVPELRTHWVPESIDAGAYASPTPLSARPVDLMFMGRRFEPFDRAIAASDACADIVQAAPSGVSHDELRAILGRSRMLVCFPRTMTHPHKAGGLETMTQRYLEGMAAGCLIVGTAPRELVDLFGYDPVLDASDPATAAEVVDAVRRTPEHYQSLVERNLARLHEVGTTTVRAREIIERLRAT